MRHVVEALIALSPSANGFTASDLAARVRLFREQSTAVSAAPPPTAITQQLVDAAKQEGTVAFYTSIGAAHCEEDW
jgi:hypothetical protein